MSTISTDTTTTNQPKTDPPSDNENRPVPREVVFRETVESLAIAFILALIFKGFIAEAFVIPTGSMAPTLMGKHKDVACESCGFRYQCGASSEFDQLGRRLEKSTVVGTVCPLCRKPQAVDPFTDKNHATFSGDRILVSKFAYAWNKPARWDVIVFKYFEDARLNYIKRCVGLPNEIIRIQRGDIYVQDRSKQSAEQVAQDDPVASEDSAFEIARKPPHVANALLQPINDTKYISRELVEAGVPSYWQPQSPEDSSWTVEWTPEKWSAHSKNSSQNDSWLRYFHRVIDIPSWNYLVDNGSLPTPPKARQARIITDFTAYNASYNASHIPDDRDSYIEQVKRDMRRSLPNDDFGNDGVHWTGDLAGEFDVEIMPGTRTLKLMIVEAGAKHLVEVDLQTGKATASVVRGDEVLSVFESPEGTTNSATAETALRANGKHTLKFTNVDDQFILWVNNKVVDWKPSNKLNWSKTALAEEPGPDSTDSDPLDGAPVGISVTEGEIKISRARVFRDIYYIAHGRGGGSSLSDYASIREKLRLSVSRTLLDEYVDNTYGSTIQDLSHNLSDSALYRDLLAQSPHLWGVSLMTSARRTFQYSMQDDWYFPLGDNSAASSDARSWEQSHTPERLMIGRAIVVFWPHWWNAPIPFMPNFQRMGLIR